MDALHAIYAKSFQALRVELELAGNTAQHNSRVLWAQSLSRPLDLDLRCSLYVRCWRVLLLLLAVLP